jgi:hypothetical protein
MVAMAEQYAGKTAGIFHFQGREMGRYVVFAVGTRYRVATLHHRLRTRVGLEEDQLAAP